MDAESNREKTPAGRGTPKRHSLDLVVQRHAIDGIEVVVAALSYRGMSINLGDLALSDLAEQVGDIDNIKAPLDDKDLDRLATLTGPPSEEHASLPPQVA